MLRPRQALVFLAVLLLAGLAILLQLNGLSQALGVASLLLVALYPLAKRVTWWPQLMMGFTFGFGAPLGYAAGPGRLDAAWAALYGAAILWDLGFDTIYAHQDREDDALVGVKSTARLFRRADGAVPRRLLRRHGPAAGAGRLVRRTGRLVLSGAGAARAAARAGRSMALDIDDPALCLRLFRANREAGLAVAAAILVGWIGSPMMAKRPPKTTSPLSSRSARSVRTASEAATIRCCPRVPRFARGMTQVSWDDAESIAAARFRPGAQTMPGRAPLVPEISLHLASEITPIWQATEAWLAERNVEPPFWAFAWPGGQALARHVLDHPFDRRRPPRARLRRRRRHRRHRLRTGRRGIGRGGGDRPPGTNRDRAECRGERRLNDAAQQADVVGAACRWDLILCGDVCYEAPMTAHILPWLRSMARQAEVWLADPGRAYLPREGSRAFASYRVPTSLELEDCTERQVTLYRLGG